MQVASASYRSVGCPMPQQKDRCSLDVWKQLDISLSPWRINCFNLSVSIDWTPCPQRKYSLNPTLGQLPTNTRGLFLLSLNSNCLIWQHIDYNFFFQTIFFCLNKNILCPFPWYSQVLIIYKFHVWVDIQCSACQWESSVELMNVKSWVNRKCLV